MKTSLLCFILFFENERKKKTFEKRRKGESYEPGTCKTNTCIISYDGRRICTCKAENYSGIRQQCNFKNRNLSGNSLCTD